jgi:cytochrome P450
MTSALVSASDDARALNGNEVLGFLFLLVIAGNETTTKLIGNALYWLWRFPDQRAPLLADSAQVPGAIEEVLRFDPPVQRSVTQIGVINIRG